MQTHLDDISFLLKTGNNHEVHFINLLIVLFVFLGWIEHTHQQYLTVEDEQQFCEGFPALEEAKTPYYSFMMPMDYLVMTK